MQNQHNTIKNALLVKLYALGSLILLPTQAHSANLDNADDFLKTTGNTATGARQAPEVESVLAGFIKTALSLVGIIFLILMVYAGYLWLTAQGEDAQIDKAKKIIKSTVIGLFLVTSAYAITQLVLGGVS
tara:strand:- start:12 stop:401 length:390 start_codon:yes stop_codon:yes gene_type:complete